TAMKKTIDSNRMNKREYICPETELWTMEPFMEDGDITASGGGNSPGADEFGGKDNSFGDMEEVEYDMWK
ncbi:MAG: hypothetical protein IJM81_09100, partial [Prevotella sp.]|nr:hypothetical protein [Prevotella sp.]